jgi:CBS domain-containing protein
MGELGWQTDERGGTIMGATVRQILKAKGSDIWAIGPQATVFDALVLMAEKDIGAVVVVEAEKLVGIFSERDYARKVVLKGRTSKATKVGELMTPGVFYVHLDQTVEECMALMTNKHIRHLPVMDNDKLVGMITIGDAVKAVIADQAVMIQSLENYIRGGYGH